MDGFRNIPGGMAVATIIGVLDAFIVWGIAAVFDVAIQVPDRSGGLTDLTFAPIVIVVAAAAVAAGILLWLLQRFVPDRAVTIFHAVSLIVLALSLVGPFLLDQPLEAQLALVAMNLLAGSAIIATFTWVATEPRPRAR